MGDLPGDILAGTRRVYVAPTITSTTGGYDKATKDDLSDEVQGDGTKTN